jgi:TonB family protein
MPSTLHSTGNALEIADRRARIRALATPPIYVNLDNLNGGLVFNISEDGLALTAALDLAGDSMFAIRILLPGSDGWIEAKGEIAWRGKSRKEGGVRFIGLAEDARRRIAHWIAAEASLKESPLTRDAGGGFVGVAEGVSQRAKNWSAPETWREEFPAEKQMKQARIPPGGQKENAGQRLRNWIFQEPPCGEFSPAKDEIPESEKHIIDISSVRAPSKSIPQTANSPLIADQERGVIVPAESDIRLNEKTGVAEVSPPPALVLPDLLRSAGGVLNAAERRAQTRTAIMPPVYVNLENTNGGLAFNMSEDGIALTAALALTGNHTMGMRIQIPDSKGWMEVSGQLAWRSESGKTVGITFIGVPEDSRQRIRDWLAAEALGGELPTGARTLSKLEQHPTGDVPAEIPMAPLPAILNANSTVEKRMLEAILSGDRLASLDAPAKVSISRQEPQRELRKEIVRLPGSHDGQADIQENSRPKKISNSGEVPSLRVVQEDWRASVPAHLAVPDMRRDKLPATADALEAVRQQLPERGEFSPKARRAFDWTTSGRRTGELRRVAAVVTLAGATAAGIGWIATQPAVQNEMTAVVAQNTEGASKPAVMNTTRPWNKTTNDPVVRPKNSRSQTHEFEPMPARGRATGSETRSASARPQEIERPAARSTVNGAVRRTEGSLPKSQLATVLERAVVGVPTPSVENTRNQVAESSPVGPTESSPAPAKSPSASVAGGAAVSDVKEKASPTPVADEPTAAAAPTWSVAVSADPYPSIRMPRDKSSQKASSARSLQIGRVISRLEPVYPEEAKSQGIVGTVTLHVVVGRDGSVQSVEPMSGSGLLAKAAISAVREWRYAQTLLGGQPVETEQDIVVTFRVAGPSISKN